MNAIFNKIRDWAQTRGIYKHGDIKTLVIKVTEEVGELSAAVLKDDKREITDAIGDIVVALTSVAHFHGVSIEDCIESAYNEISDRKGKMNNGTFEKER